MSIRNPHQNRLAMSLRLWSDSAELGTLIDDLHFDVEHLHTFGKPIEAKGVVAGRIALRNYASLANKNGINSSDLRDWLENTLEKVCANKDLTRCLADGSVICTLWISILGPNKQSLPQIEPKTIEQAANLRISILVENYTDLKSGNPQKTWIVR